MTDVISSLKIPAMVLIYTSIGSENNFFEGQIVRNSRFKILCVVDRWSKIIISLDTIWHKNFYLFCIDLQHGCALETKKMVKWFRSEPNSEIIFLPYLIKALWKNVYNVLFSFRGYFCYHSYFIAIFLSWDFDKLKIMKFKG